MDLKIGSDLIINQTFPYILVDCQSLWIFFTEFLSLFLIDKQFLDFILQMFYTQELILASILLLNLMFEKHIFLSIILFLSIFIAINNR